MKHIVFKSNSLGLGGITKMSFEVVVIFISTIEETVKALQINETSAVLKSAVGTVGKSNSIK